MRRKGLLALPLLMLAVLVAILCLNRGSSASQSLGKEKKMPERSVQATVPDEDLELKHPGKKPYVAPQPHVKVPAESARLETPKIVSRTTAGVGTPTGMPGPDLHALTGFAFGKDKLVSNFDGNYGNRINPDVAISKIGHIYAAMETVYGSVTYIQVCRSIDYGKTWEPICWAYNISASLKTPSIAIGEGAINGDRLLLAYIVDDGTNPPYPEVATKPLGSVGQATVQSIPHFNQPYAKPIIRTDSPHYSDWYAYLVAEWHYDASVNNINIEYWRSIDGGLTWPDDANNRKYVYGNTDTYEWREPDVAYGENDKVFITAYRKDTKTIYITKDFGGTTLAVTTLPYAPVTEAYPRIAACYQSSNLMIVYTEGSSAGDDQAFYAYSNNSGNSWNGPFIFPDQTTSHARRPIVTTSPYPTGYFHAIFTEGYDVFHYRRPIHLSTMWSQRKRVSDRDYASHTYPQKGIAAFHDNAHAFIVWADFYDPYYQIRGDRTYPDDFLGSWTGQGVYFRTERGTWVNMASPATLIFTGDIDNDGTDDLIGIWPGQGGVWVKYSSTGTWALLSSTARDIASGDMNGDGRDDLLGTWDGQGVYYRNSASGAWVKMATPATLVAAGDIDNDGTDDLIGIWPGQGGVWVKYSSSSAWAKISSTARDIGAGDMNGDGRDDLLGTWDGQGVYYRNSASGAWVKMATPATLVAAGDLDSDGTDDLIGIWPGQGGVWVKYSSTGTWALLSSTAVSIDSGLMRGGGNSWTTGAWRELLEPIGGDHIAEPYIGMPGSEDVSDFGPGRPKLRLNVENFLIPAGEVAPIPGPGMPGFTFEVAPNQVPGEKQERERRPIRR